MIVLALNLDRATMQTHNRKVTINDGFPGQRLLVLPRPLVAYSLGQPGTSHLVVTDCGYFPIARSHRIVRSEGVDQAIVVVCVRGRGSAIVGGHRYGIGPGQVLVIPPATAHEYGAEESEPWTIWWIHVAGPDLPELLRTSRFTALTAVREVRDPYRVMALIEEVVHTLESDSTASSLLQASGAAWHLLATLSANSRSPGASFAMDRARDYVKEHLAERVSIDDLASMASLSASHFAVSFRARFGVPVKRFQTELRMARARELLELTDLSVAAIAAEVGYNDPFYFSRKFRAVHGVTARLYRAQQKG